MSRHLDCGIPTPVSYTSMRRWSPRRRQPTSTRPSGVYLMALDTRFWISRRKSRRSERTTSLQGMKVRSSPLAAARGAYSRSIWRISSSMRKLANSGRNAPVSSREMSSSAPKISSTASSEASILSTRRRSSRPPRSIRLVTYSRAALSGCKMSWLAAARNLVLEILAASASPLACSSAALSRVNSSVRSRTRRSSVSFDRSSASAASTLAVMSVNVVAMPPSGMRLERTSMTIPSAKRSRNGSLAEM